MTEIKGAPTLDDVAKAAGVSTATVSRCLNSSGRVVAATRDRVMRAVSELGYTPNFGARVMAAKRTYTIGAIIPTMENAIFARGLQAFQEELHTKGYTLLVASSAYRPEIEEEQIRALVSRGADGLLLIGHDRAASIYDYLERQNVPALVSWSYQSDARVPSVGFSNSDAMQELAEEVIRAGHRNVAMISGICEGNDRAKMRVQGLKKALKQYDINPDDVPIIETPYEIDGGAAAFASLMELTPRPTTVLCGNDVLAVGALRKAHDLGLDIPGDVSITGFDDIELAQIVNPPLTTVHVPHREMGCKAACELVNLVEKTSDGKSIKLQTFVSKRNSLARNQN
ncbi:Catabolite control protein A [Roseovarius albus]|uniref:Catabolite control protein A n=1 Tax=Roseovarius albus TaxID=1247867 RepID=A0A1X6YV48_9RHOB|nr:LacI family DNA-binding transcriptional regulator [Roseovarius albus]SLN31609.1 Catabolite control protein A [Roseovarius albus]